MHISVRCKVSMIKVVTGMAVHRCQCKQRQRQTEHDCIGSLPNEPIRHTPNYLIFSHLKFYIATNILKNIINGEPPHRSVRFQCEAKR